MGDFLNLFDLLLFMYILFMSIALALIDGHFALPEHMFHPLLVNLKNWYIQEFGDYLVSEKLHFFVGLIWLDLFFAWPLCVLSVYAIANGKSWINTTCLLHGASTLTSLNRESDQDRSQGRELVLGGGRVSIGSSVLDRGRIPQSQIGIGSHVLGQDGTPYIFYNPTGYMESFLESEAKHPVMPRIWYPECYMDEDSLITLIAELRCYWFSGARTSKPMLCSSGTQGLLLRITPHITGWRDVALSHRVTGNCQLGTGLMARCGKIALQYWMGPESSPRRGGITLRRWKKDYSEFEP
ncbi:putative transmembrane protein 97-like [Capsicum annuum]|nr:putative transmembrane protein 97-like [Capsicum annuum]KAF3680824.1 putative transmembrane protein 97-like [Capsicum annuum]